MGPSRSRAWPLHHRPAGPSPDHRQFFPEITRATSRPNHSTIVTPHQRLRLQLEEEAAAGTSFLVKQFGPEFAGTTLRGLEERLYQELVKGS